MKDLSRRAVLATLSTFLCIFLVTAGAAYSQENAPEPSSDENGPVTVGLNISPPFVMKEGHRFTGMSIELWEAIASQLGRASTYREFDTVKALIQAITTGEVDVAVTNLTVTEDRAQFIDFTQPWFDGGLRILVNERSQAGLGDVVAGLSDAGFLRGYAWIALIIVSAAIVFTVFDRHFDKDFPRGWRHGFAESFYTVMQMATSGKPVPRKNFFGWIGRIWQGLWLMAGIAVLAYVTSSVTSVMTALSLTNQIHSVQDLSGKTIGVLRGTVANDFVQEAGFSNQTFLQIEDAVAALQNGTIDAVVEDAPILEYYSHSHPDAEVRVVGRIFAPDKYAFGVPQRSSLRRAVTIQILAAQERGEIQQLRAKYFGKDP